MNRNFVKYCEAAEEKIENIRFVLAGDIADNVKKDILGSRIADKFEHVGYIENVENYYESIDVLGYLLNDDNYATTENVLLEAMAYAVPIVALNQGVEGHILKDGCSGYLVNSIEEYAGAIDLLYSSEKKRKALGEKARKFCIEKYSHEKNRKTYWEILHKCMDGSKRVHRIECLADKEPFEWLLFFAQKDSDAFYREIDESCIQESKGSVFQYLKYFQTDVNLRNVCAVGNMREKR